MTRGLLANAAYFEALYRAQDDPWGYATSPYEQSKYQVTIDALPRDRYESALEIGCSIGVFTALLAHRCQRLLAVDASPTAVQRTRERCRHMSHVQAEQRCIPSEFPAATFDLITLAETGYYLTSADLLETARRSTSALRPGGHLLLVHHTEPIDDATMSGDAVHATILQATNGVLRHVLRQQFPLYRLDMLEHAAERNSPRRSLNPAVAR